MCTPLMPINYQINIHTRLPLHETPGPYQKIKNFISNIFANLSPIYHNPRRIQQARIQGQQQVVENRCIVGQNKRFSTKWARAQDLLATKCPSFNRRLELGKVDYGQGIYRGKPCRSFNPVIEHRHHHKIHRSKQIFLNGAS